ncbi:group-specific protein [Bacillus sp. FJAT-47783]|uniref:group-specific protein n=1 Tax=Bacillus sp. FJAT-47783 TaxID=2922712 RepID=UPI001FAC3F08|nr:group-specific protein [Bacillus sp. FJAT-47783]
MGTCNIDHSIEDVKNKFLAQSSVLPDEIKALFESFFMKEHSQEVLNEVFHLLKKYDLSSEAEQQERNVKLTKIITNRSQ